MQYFVGEIMILSGNVKIMLLKIIVGKILKIFLYF